MCLKSKEAVNSIVVIMVMVMVVVMVMVKVMVIVVVVMMIEPRVGLLACNGRYGWRRRVRVKVHTQAQV